MPLSPRVLVISHDVIGRSMAGPGIRYWEMARALAMGQPVTLIAPQPIDLPSPLPRCGDYVWGDPASLERWLHDVDVVIANGFVLFAHPELASIPQALVVDLYDPVLLENLELFRSWPELDRVKQNRQDVALLERQLAGGDFYICATERQRDLYIGSLMAAGCITPGATDNDPQLRALIDVVPFGLPVESAVKRQPALRGVVPGIDHEDVVLLWTGGLWDWMDPLTLIEAMPQIVEQHPHTRLVLLAGRHPGTVQPMSMPGKAKGRAAALGLEGTHVFFYEHWVPYEARADFLLEADVAISLHRTHLETAYAAVRSRFLDHLWAGLPSVVSDGDAAAALVRTHELGAIVPPGNIQATAATICEVITDKQRREHCSAHARELAQTLTWERIVEPLVRFCQVPRKRREPTLRNPPIVPSFVVKDTGMQHEQQNLMQQMEGLWQFGVTEGRGNIVARVARGAMLRLLGPIIGRQREFNGAAVKLLYTLREENDQTRSYLHALAAQTVALQRELHAQIDTSQRDLHGRLDTLQRDMHGRLDTLSAFDGEVNDRLTRLVYTAQLLDDAVAAADEADATLASHLADLALRLPLDNGASQHE